MFASRVGLSQVDGHALKGLTNLVELDLSDNMLNEVCGTCGRNRVTKEEKNLKHAIQNRQSVNKLGAKCGNLINFYSFSFISLSTQSLSVSPGPLCDPELRRAFPDVAQPEGQRHTHNQVEGLLQVTKIWAWVKIQVIYVA